MCQASRWHHQTVFFFLKEWHKPQASEMEMTKTCADRWNWEQENVKKWKNKAGSFKDLNKLQRKQVPDELPERSSSL